MDKFAALRTFVAVVNTGSFARAAAKLGLSRAMATKHVQTLEADLGARLLNRTTRKLSTTEAGRAFHARAERVLADLDEAEAAVADATASPRGLLRVAGPMSFGFRQLGPAIADFMTECPDMAIELSLNDRIVDLVDEGLDVAVRIGRLAESSLVARRLASARLVAVAAPAYLARKGTPKSPADLAWHDCLDYTLSSTGPEWRFIDRNGRMASARVAGPLKANNGDVLLEAALAGRGIVLSTSFIAGPEIAAGRLVDVFAPAWLGEELPIHAVYPAARHLSVKVRRFVDFLAARFAKAPWEAGVQMRRSAKGGK
ncbi:MAG: LysR family transcriptional regulator [Tagaea sp.]